jgi:hypothetical protein
VEVAKPAAAAAGGKAPAGAASHQALQQQEQLPWSDPAQTKPHTATQAAYPSAVPAPAALTLPRLFLQLPPSPLLPWVLQLQ